MMRSSALSLALSYVGLGLAALVLFAAPLWYAWQVTIQEGRTEILQADAQRLTDVYRRDGADGLKNFIDARVRMQIAGERILLLTDASMHPLAGNLHAWPASVPAVPGNYTIHVNMGTHGEQTALVHVALLGSNNLLVGRDNLLFKPLQTLFLVRPDGGGRRAVHRRIVRRPHHAPRIDVAGSQHPPHRIGHHPRRPQAPPADAFE